MASLFGYPMNPRAGIDVIEMIQYYSSWIISRNRTNNYAGIKEADTPDFVSDSCVFTKIIRETRLPCYFRPTCFMRQVPRVPGDPDRVTPNHHGYIVNIART